MAGEITTNAVVDFQPVARDTIKQIGYDNTDYGIDYKGCAVLVAYDKQSPDIAQGVDEGKGLNLEQGAGDQGLMFGYACTETEGLMPLPIYLAHRLVERQAQLRKNGKLKWLRPDAKSQVTVKYVDGKPAEIDTVVLSTQHHPEIEHKQIEQAVIEEIIKPVLPARRCRQEHQVPGQSRPVASWSAVRRATAVSPAARSSSIPTAARRRTAAARSRARILPRSTARRRMPRATSRRTSSPRASPASARCRCRTRSASPSRPASWSPPSAPARCPTSASRQLVRQHFDLRPKGIVQMLDLLRPIYEKTAAYGHFGRNEPEFTWEKTDKAAALAADAGARKTA